jgi:hypothetical protein
MKKVILMTAALLSSALIIAQTSEKPVTVRIKKIEKINGVEKVTDTTFTTTDLSSLHRNHPNVRVFEGENGKEHKIERVVIEGGDINPEDVDVKVIHHGAEMDEEIKKALKEAGVDPDAKGTKKVVIVQDDIKGEEGSKGEKRITKIVMLRTDMTCASEEDKKRLKNQIGSSDDKLEIDKMSLYPNPGDGKFNLKFNLKNKEDAEVTIYNSEGKPVYNEKLPSFTGEYNKPIDISNNSKGIYFVKVVQGKHAMVKKVVME